MKTRSGHLVKRGKFWHVQYRVDGKLHSRSTGKSNKKDAERERGKIMAPFAAGSEVDVLQNVSARIEGRRAEIRDLAASQQEALLVSRAWRAYILSHNRPDSGDSTLQQYEYQFQAFSEWLLQAKGDLALQDVDDGLATEYANHLLERKLAAGTFNKHLRLLHLVFETLADQGFYSGENPWRKRNIRRKVDIQVSRRELTVDELKRICEAAAGDLRLLFAIGIYTGLRLGDCATLRWGEVDLAQGLIRRIPLKTSRRRAKPVFIPIHPFLAEVLHQVSEKDRKGYVLAQTAEQYMSRRDDLCRDIQSHFENRGISTQKPGTGPGTGKRAVVEVGFHSLRHTFVSLCRANKAPMAVVAAIVGHSSPAMTQHYTHVGVDSSSQVVASLPQVFSETD